MSLVVDASVACKWFFFEENHPEADKLLREEQLAAPDLLYCEVGNVLWKRVRSGKLSEQLAEEALARLATIPILFADTRSLLNSTLEIAVAHDRTFYDSMYLTLAVARRTVVVTADERLVNSLAGTQLAAHVRLLGG